MQRPLDLVGKRFGKLKVLSRSENKNKKSAWLCKCNCGKQKVIIGSSLVKENGTKSCGCLQKNHFVDLTGKKYNELTIKQLIGKNKGKCWLYLCECSCGNETIQEGNDVKSGKIKSCGCLRFKSGVNKANKEPLKALINNLYSDYKKKAEYRNIEFNLDYPEFKKLVLDKCYYCGISHSNVKKHSKKRKIAINMDLKYNGIDRVDNKEGYTSDNVVTACRFCNQAKHQMEQDFFFDWIKRVYSNLEGLRETIAEEKEDKKKKEWDI